MVIVLGIFAVVSILVYFWDVQLPLLTLLHECFWLVQNQIYVTFFEEFGTTSFVCTIVVNKHRNLLHQATHFYFSDQSQDRPSIAVTLLLLTVFVSVSVCVHLIITYLIHSSNLHPLQFSWHFQFLCFTWQVQHSLPLSFDNSCFQCYSFP